MRTGAALGLIGILSVAGCGQGPISGSPATAARVARTPSSPGSVAASPQTLAGPYGILLSPPGRSSDIHLELIGADATIAASVPIASPSLSAQACGQGMGAWLEPPVSATDDEVYYRDGDTEIRMVVPPSSSLT